MLLGDCSPAIFHCVQNSVAYKTRYFQDTRCKDISFKSLNCVVYSDTNFNTVQCTKPSLIILKDAGIFNMRQLMRALQIDFHPIPRVHTFLSHCLFKFPFHV